MFPSKVPGPWSRVKHNKTPMMPCVQPNSITKAHVFIRVRNHTTLHPNATNWHDLDGMDVISAFPFFSMENPYPPAWQKVPWISEWMLAPFSLFFSYLFSSFPSPPLEPDLVWYNRRVWTIFDNGQRSFITVIWTPLPPASAPQKAEYRCIIL